ncbi:MAG: NAD(P)-dependent oxidoreductase [Candidatus Latescibacterota bacterium]|nr:MAG: NAD(P)-dependent oxidoreductase [Candidatus Latescibacterota bacterium]
MKVLVTGANGFLGTAVVERLLAHGETDIRCVVRRGRGVSRLGDVSSRFPEAAVETCVGDLRSAEFAREVVGGADIVYHLAAAMRGSAADLFQNTVVSSKNLLDALIEGGARRVVLVSSFGVYGTSDLPRGAVIDETTPLEPHPERRDHYSYSKIRQEQLFHEYRQKHGLPLVVVRPGVVYGPGGAAISTRVGIRVFGIFFHFGRNNLLPLTYVDNCAEAIVIASRQGDGDVYNVVDDDLPTSKKFLRLYRRDVERMRYVTTPYFVTVLMSRLVERYHAFSKGQLPAVLTPYKSSNLWKGHTFDNSKLKSTGWRQLVGTEEGLQRFLAYWRTQHEGADDD